MFYFPCLAWEGPKPFQRSLSILPGVSQQSCPERGENLGDLVGFARRGWLKSRGLSCHPLSPDHSLSPTLLGSSCFQKKCWFIFFLCQIPLGSGPGDSGSSSNPGLYVSPSHNHRHVTNAAHPAARSPTHHFRDQSG